MQASLVTPLNTTAFGLYLRMWGYETRRPKTRLTPRFRVNLSYGGREIDYSWALDPQEICPRRAGAGSHSTCNDENGILRMTTTQSPGVKPLDQVRRPPLDRQVGVVTTVTAVMAGEQSITIDVVGAGDDEARVVVRWGRVAMTFTSAEQVQRVLGLFGLARQAMIGVAQRMPLPLDDVSVSDVSVLTALTWTRTPTGSASVEQMYHEGVRRSIKYVALTIRPITFHILDRDGLDSVTRALVRAHRLAVTVYPDGHRFAGDPNTAGWKRTNRRHLKPLAGTWSHR
ncbi:hypothetical protein ACFWPX_03085 [Nocardia sp. NPDC058518]|uniref:hypothetical protein n=1 Tax=Nocardia sp. NPDC058518 TaxID=3346534 RepID=UPI0036467ED8